MLEFNAAFLRYKKVSAVKTIKKKMQNNLEYVNWNTIQELAKASLHICFF